MDITLNLPVVKDESHRTAALTELLTTSNLAILTNGLWSLTNSTQKHADGLERIFTTDKTKDHTRLRELWAKDQEELKLYQRLRDLTYQIHDSLEIEEDD